MLRRMLCTLLALIMLMSSVPAAFADGELSGTVRYCSGHGSDNTHDYETYFSYSDNYFGRSGYIYWQDLAEASLALALASFSSKDAQTLSDEDRNFVSMMQQCGFENISSNEWFGKKPEMSSIGVCAASKSVKDNYNDYTLIAVGIRGNFYRREWGGNAVVGSSGDHEGFSLASAQVLSYLKQFISENSISGPVKVWMAGYSRSAAVANMAAAQLDRGYDLGSAKLMRNDLYCYCFEPPMGTTSNDSDNLIYGNIHNIVNENDLVTYVVFDQWGFSRYGVDHTYPTKGDADYDELKAAMIDEFDGIPNNGGSYSIDDFKYIGLRTAKDGSFKTFSGSKMTQKQYYKLLSDAMVTDFVSSREDYSDNVQDSLAEVLAVIFDRKQFDYELLFRIFGQKLKDNLFDIISGYDASDVGSSKACKTVEQLFFESLNEAGITEFDAQGLRTALSVLLTRLTKLMVNNPDIALTLIANISPIISAHYAETCIAWMHTLPDDYMSSKIEKPDFNGLFTDINGDEWYAEAAAYNDLGGIMCGIGNSVFAPNLNMSRAMFACVLYRLSGSSSVAETVPFTDVSSSAWYSNAVAWAYSRGIITGCPDGSFCPDANVSRQEAATMLYRFAGSPDCGGKDISFADTDSVSNYACSAVSWAESSGIIYGYSDGCFKPNDAITRAEAAAMIMRCCEA